MGPPLAILLRGDAIEIVRTNKPAEIISLERLRAIWVFRSQLSGLGLWPFSQYISFALSGRDRPIVLEVARKRGNGESYRRFFDALADNVSRCAPSVVFYSGVERLTVFTAYLFVIFMFMIAVGSTLTVALLVSSSDLAYKIAPGLFLFFCWWTIYDCALDLWYRWPRRFDPNSPPVWPFSRR